MWTRFMDMHSGGGCKEPPYDKILIEAPEDEARRVFYAKFGHNPERVTCTCCGEDYSITESPTLSDATAYDRGCIWIKPVWAEDRLLTAEKRKEANELSRYLEYGEGMPDGFVSSFPWRSSVSALSLDEYLALPTVLVVSANDITDTERSVNVPSQGYVWVD